MSEFKEIAKIFGVVLTPVVIGLLFTPLVHANLDLRGVGNGTWTDEVSMAFWVSLVTFGLVGLVALIVTGALYQRAGVKAWNEARELYPEHDTGWLDYGFFYYAFQVGDNPVVCTRFAPKEKKVGAFIV